MSKSTILCLQWRSWSWSCHGSKRFRTTAGCGGSCLMLRTASACCLLVLLLLVLLPLLALPLFTPLLLRSDSVWLPLGAFAILIIVVVATQGVPDCEDCLDILPGSVCVRLQRSARGKQTPGGPDMGR